MNVMFVSKNRLAKDSGISLKQDYRIRKSNINHLINRVRNEEKSKKREAKIVFAIIIASFSVVGFVASL